VDHTEKHGELLFHLVCREDLEGIVLNLFDNVPLSPR